MSTSTETVEIKKSFAESLLTVLPSRKQRLNEKGDCFEKVMDLEGAVREHTCPEVHSFISKYLDLTDHPQRILFCTREMSRTKEVEFDQLRAIVNLKRLNYAKNIDEHLRALNTLLPEGGIYIGRAETYWERKRRISRLWGKRLGAAVWILDSIMNRAFARMRVVEHLYRWVTRSTFHMLSSTELLGRIFYCGFSLINMTRVDGLKYFAVIKTGEPSTAPPPSRHLLFRMSRVGKGGKMIWVYKFRTMHPYSEYVQDYIVKMNGYNLVGKPNNDWRITGWGRWMRKLWIDEIPQVINILKLEMKVVGVRPLSKYRFNQFPAHIQDLRIQDKPGCIPPYVALNMPDEHGNIKAEIIYLCDKQRWRFAVDFRYFWKAVYNILSNRIRSS